MLINAKEAVQKSQKAKHEKIENAKRKTENYQYFEAKHTERISEQIDAYEKLLEDIRSRAKNGHFHIITTPQIDLDKFIRIDGFQFKHLNRRDSFEQHLTNLHDAKNSDLIKACDHLMHLFPRIEIPETDTPLHRNPLLSLMENTYAHDDIHTTKEVINNVWHIFDETISNINPPSELISKLKTIKHDFEELKRIREKLEEVKYSNELIPLGSDQATLILWQNPTPISDQHTNEAIAMHWLAHHWKHVANRINRNIDQASAEGKFHIQLFISNRPDGWSICFPDENSFDFMLTFDKLPGTDIHAILTDELNLSGYKASWAKSDKEEDEDEDEDIDEDKGGTNSSSFDSYVITIDWENSE